MAPFKAIRLKTYQELIIDFNIEFALSINLYLLIYLEYKGIITTDRVYNLIILF